MSKLYRRRTFPNGVKLDELAAKNSDATLENGKPVIYNGSRDALETTDKVDIDTLTADTIVTEDLYVNGKMVVDDVETIESVGDNIVLRANNSSGLANGETSGIIVNHYNTNGDLLAIQTDNTGTVRLATGVPVQTTYVNIYYSLSDNKWYSDAELTTEVTVEGVLTSWDTVDITDDYKHYTHAVFSSTNFSNAEAVLTRDEEANLNDQGLLVWDADDTEAKTIALPTNDEDELVPSYIDAVTVSHPIVTDGTNFYDVNNTFATTTTEPAGTAGTPTSLGQTTELDGNYYYKATNNNWYIVNGTTTVGGNVIYDMGAQVTDEETIDSLEASTDFVTFYYVVYTETTVPGKWTYSWRPKKAGTYVFATITDYEQYETDHPGAIPVGSQVIIEANKNYIKSEDIE